jgi:hypothetical protein
MHARVATFETGDAGAVRRGLEELGSRAASGPPDGVPAVGLLVLHDPDANKVLAISFFKTEDDLRQGDAALNSSTPPGPAEMGRRTGVETFEVAVNVTG